jgi:hypothetical protein
MPPTMRIGVLLSAGLAVCAAAWAADDVAPLNVKPGQWETTVTIARSGQLPIPPEVLEKMTPEQRAVLEERMKASAAQVPQTRVAKRCFTKEDLANAYGANEDNKTCKRTIVTSSPSGQEFKIECTNGQMTSTGAGHVDVIDSEHIGGKTKLSMTRGGQTMTVETTFSSKWLGADCPVSPAKKQP